VRHIYLSDADRPDRRSPLAQPGVDVAEGDVLLAINGQSLLSVSDPAELLRNQAGKQVLVRLRPKDKTEPREVVVKAITTQQEGDLRYALNYGEVRFPVLQQFLEDSESEWSHKGEPKLEE